MRIVCLTLKKQYPQFQLLQTISGAKYVYFKGTSRTVLTRLNDTRPTYTYIHTLLYLNLTVDRTSPALLEVPQSFPPVAARPSMTLRHGWEGGFFFLAAKISG
jgi:hypothetical protein